MKVKGFYVFEHKPTGQRYTGASTDVYKDVVELKKKLTTASTGNKRLDELARREPEFVNRITSCDTIAEARKLEKRFREMIRGDLLLN